MKKAAIYFGQEAIYNLEDLSVIGQFLSRDTKQLYKQLVLMAQTYTITIAVMGFNQPLRNALYTIFPRVTIVINPLDVQEMITSYLSEGQMASRAYEEIAATVMGAQASYLVPGCQGIYDYQTKAAAMDYYKQWQADVPLGTLSYHQVIQTIDDYYEEVFNYFDIGSILSQAHDKIRPR